MNRKARRAARSGSAAGLPAALDALNRGDPAAASVAAQAVLDADPRSAPAHYLLATACLLQGRADDAEAGYRRAIALAPGLAEAHNNLGLILERRGRPAEAAACYRRAIGAKPAYAEAHNNLGNALLALGSGDEAIAAFRAALTVRPAYPEACYNLANALAGQERGDEAVAAYRRALVLRPRFVQALNNLSALLLDLGRPQEAMAAAGEAVEADLAIGEGHRNLGHALRACGRSDEAISAYRRALACQPGDADAHLALANALVLAGGGDEAQDLFRRAHRLRPLGRRAGAKTPPDFAVLLLVAPGAANTPSDYLVGRGDYDSFFLAVMEGAEYDLDLLRRHADVVVNLISDVDQGRAILPRAVELAESIGRPVLNHPRLVLATGRDAVAARLAGLPRCRIPRTERRTGAALADPAALEGFTFPLLVRAGGAHGGEAFDLLDTAEAVAAFGRERPESDHYVSEFVDYRSADGYFRKYRLAFTGGRILPYHLAISGHWKVHHFRTDMANQAWMRREEEDFLRDPAGVFDAGHWSTLRQIQQAIGLDHFGIDCALDRAGHLVVFEVNASMLFHGEKGIFAYKDPYVARIKREFDDMLARAAGARDSLVDK